MKGASRRLEKLASLPAERRGLFVEALPWRPECSHSVSTWRLRLSVRSIWSPLPHNHIARCRNLKSFVAVLGINNVYTG